MSTSMSPSWLPRPLEYAGSGRLLCGQNGGKTDAPSQLRSRYSGETFGPRPLERQLWGQHSPLPGACGTGSSAPKAVRPRGHEKSGGFALKRTFAIPLPGAGACRRPAAIKQRCGGTNALSMICWKHGVPRSQMSATPDSTIADSSRTIADLRRKLAECEAERDAALAREAATTEVLGVINSSPGGLAPVFDAMLERAMRLCGAAFGVFAIFDEEHYQVVATNGLPLELAEFVRQAVRIHAGSMPDHLRRGENTIQVPDITALGSELRTPGLVAMIELGKARTAVWVALRKDGVAQGFIGVYRQDVRPFSDNQIALLQNFAAQTVIAMENARFIIETREALEQQTATAEVLRTIANSPADAESALDTIAQVTSRLFDASNVNIRRLDADILRYAATFGLGAAEFRARAPEAPLDPRSLPGSAIIEKRQISIDDVRDPVVLERFPSAALIGPSRTRVATPLLREGQAIGAIITQPHRLFEDRVKYGREITGRGIDDMKNFSGYTQ